MAPIRVKKNLFKNTVDRKCLHIELDITESGPSYEASDHVAIYPSNDPILVSKIGELLNANLDIKFSLVSIEGERLKALFEKVKGSFFQI